MTIKEAVVEYGNEAEFLGKRSRSWRSHAREILEVFGEDTAVTEAAKPQSVVRWMGLCRNRGNSPKTIQEKLGFLKQVCRLSTEAGVPAAFPRRLSQSIVVDNARDRVLSEREIKELKAAMRPDDWKIVEFFMKTGLRSQEGALLRVADCHFGKGTMTILADNVKTKRRRTLPLIAEPRAMAAKAAKGRHEYVLNPPGFDGYQNRISMIETWKQTVFRVALRVAGIKDFRFHDLRHVFVTHLLERGAEHVAVTHLAGWESPSYIKRYGNLRLNSLTKAMSLA